MKPFLILPLLLLLLAPRAGAEEPFSIDLKGHLGPCEPLYSVVITGVVESDGELVVTITDRFGRRVTTNCERDMREAIRAMEPFMLHNFVWAPENTTNQITFEGTKARKSKELAIRLEAVKKECWRTK
jgi:hypothetical protein